MRVFASLSPRSMAVWAFKQRLLALCAGALNTTARSRSRRSNSSTDEGILPGRKRRAEKALLSQARDGVS